MRFGGAMRWKSDVARSPSPRVGGMGGGRSQRRRSTESTPLDETQTRWLAAASCPVRTIPLRVVPSRQ